MDGTQQQSTEDNPEQQPPPGSPLQQWFTQNRDVLWRVAVATVLLYIFLVAISTMGGSFKLFGKDFARRMIENCTNPVVGLFIGIFVTSIIQSSGTTTSMIVVLVSGVGLIDGRGLPLSFAIPMIMGANIGTTITNVLVSFSFVARREDFRRAFAGAIVHDFFNLLTVTLFFPLEVKFHFIERIALRLTQTFTGAGGIVIGSPIKAITDPVRHLAENLFLVTLELPRPVAGTLLVILSAATVVVSLVYLIRTMRELIARRTEHFINKYLFRNDITAFVLGIILTVMAHSSSVTTSLMVPLVGAGIVTLERCYPFTLGANIGTTTTALLAALAVASTDNPVAVTAAFAHLTFNCMGIAVFYPLRRIPIGCARKLARLAAESKRWAFVFVGATFFGIPLLMIFVCRLLRSAV